MHIVNMEGEADLTSCLISSSLISLSKKQNKLRINQRAMEGSIERKKKGLFSSERQSNYYLPCE